MNKKTRRLLSLLLGGGRYKTISGVPPLTYKAIEGTLTNYRIYGNTVNGENVGDLITEGEHAGEYKVPVTVEGKNLLPTTNIYLPEQIKMVGQATTYMVSITPKTDESKIVFVTMSSVPDDCTILKSGLIFTLDEADANTLNSTNYADGVRGKASTTHAYKYSWTKKYTEGETYYIRSYVKYQTADNEIKEVYGDVYKADINGFERASQTINGVTFIVNSDGSITCNGTAIATAFFTINSSIDVEEGYIINGCPDVNGDAILRIANNATDYYVEDKGHGGIIDSRTSGNTKIIIRVSASYTCNNLTFYPMIRKADIEDDTYEPYHAPVTTPIYLPDQIKIVGDEAEYVDYQEQKLHRVGADDIDITLPALPVLSGTNTLTVGTEVQPSAVEIRGRISAVQTALNMAALSPVSMSMPDGFALMSESEEVVDHADNQGGYQTGEEADS